MTEFNREFFKNDPVFHRLYEVIKMNHKVADHTERVLFKNRHVKDFCEEARRRLIAYADSRIFIEYEDGVAARMLIDPHVKAGKARRIAEVIYREMRVLEKILKKFV